MKPARQLPAAIFLAAAMGCQTAPTTEAPSAVVEAPAEPAPATIGAGDPWGWALLRADRTDAPPGTPVGGILYPEVPISP